MNCNYCQAQFDHNSHVPRLLIFCGHSLCEICCKQLHNNSRIQCPQCFSNTFIEEVNFLPKNLALLKVNNTITNHNNSYCLKHEKKYQAFCKKQKVLICVDCILHDSHRNHEMDSIKNAFTVEEASLAETIGFVENLIKMNKAKYQQNVQNQRKSYENYEMCNQNLFQQFDQLRELIEKQQQNLINKIKEQYTQSQAKFEEKNTKYQQNIQHLSMCLTNLQEDIKLSEIQFLTNVSMREEIKANIVHQIEETQKILNLNQSKNLTADVVIKSIEKNFKPCNNSNSSSTHSTTSKTTPTNMGAKSKKSSNHTGPIQNMKSFESQQLGLLNQNQKPMAKKVPKKQPVPALYQNNSGVASMIVNKNSNPLTKVCPNMEADRRSTIGLKQKLSDKEKFDMGKNCDVSIVEQKQSLFNSFFSNMMTSFFTEQKFIYVVGGFDEESSNIIKFSLNSYKWEEVCLLKTPRSKFGCVAIEKNIFIMGGKKGRERASDAQVWNNGNWKISISLKKKRSGFGVVSYENFIYVIGGNDGENILNSVQVLDTLTGEWSRAEPMEEPRDQLAVCLGKDNKIYAIGGFGGKNNEPLKSVQIFDFRTQKWHRGPSLNIPRRALAAAALADGIYAIGGFDGTTHLNSVEKYEQGTSQWVRIADLKRGRCTHTAISVFDTQQIIVMGGFDQQALDSVQKYSLIINQWQQIAKMPSPRFMHSSVLVHE